MCARAYGQVVVFAFIVVALGGCVRPSGIRADPLSSDGYPRQVVMPGLEQYVVVKPARVIDSTTDRLMRITVPIRSILTDQTIHIQYRFEFLDNNGLPLDSETDKWRYKTLAPKLQEYLQGGALDTRARDWRLVVQPAK
jgi:uncharacterized protein YcfL